MANTKVYSFRFPEDTLNQIDYLLEDDKKIVWNDRRKAKNRLVIVEDAIYEKYIRRVNDIQGKELKDQIGKIVSEKIQESMEGINKQLEELLYIAIKSDLGKKLFYGVQGSFHLLQTSMTLSRSLLMKNPDGTMPWKSICPQNGSTKRSIGIGPDNSRHRTQDCTVHLSGQGKTSLYSGTVAHYFL